MANVKYLFMPFFTICMSSSVKCLLLSFVHFLIGRYVFLLSFETSLYVLDASPLLDMWFTTSTLFEE